MANRSSGPKNNNWRGGRSIASNGYVLVRVGKGHPLADCRGYAYEHRLVASDMLGRLLAPGEQFHHKNGDKQDNGRENLEVLPTRSHHSVKHRKRANSLRMPGEDNPMIECACECGETFAKYDATGRPRRFVSGHNTRGRRGR